MNCGLKQFSVYDPCSHVSYLSSGDKGLKNSGLNRHSNPGLCNADKVLCQLSYQANWELVVMWGNMVELVVMRVNYELSLLK